MTKELPVAVMGAGPVGLAAASCCGGASLTRADACCVVDAVAKEAGEAGCGCQAAGRCG